MHAKTQNYCRSVVMLGLSCVQEWAQILTAERDFNPKARRSLADNGYVLEYFIVQEQHS